jgi:hypothetical protein
MLVTGYRLLVSGLWLLVKPTFRKNQQPVESSLKISLTTDTSI